ncbi:MAG: hypothetical protein MUF34_32015 [Polyangiaceae bacterium]|nr:hypothetical protein [Polyangiaceae bacterium]
MAGGKGGGKAGAGGTAGAGGKAGTGGTAGAPVYTTLELSGGAVGNPLATFPVGISTMGTVVFVATLGNRAEEPSRLYRFLPGQTDSPEVIYEVPDPATQAIAGVAFNLYDYPPVGYVCITRHPLAVGATVPPSVKQLLLTPWATARSPADETPGFALKSTAVNVGNQGFFVAPEVKAGACGPIAWDGSSIFAPDTSGASNFLFRVNEHAFRTEPNVPFGEPINDIELWFLRTVAWFEGPQFEAGPFFGVSGISQGVVPGSFGSVWFAREDRSGQIFRVRSNGTTPMVSVPESFPLSRRVNTPSGLRALNDGKLLTASRDDNQLLELVPEGAGFTPVVLFDGAGDPAFRQPMAVDAYDDKAYVVGGQVEHLGGQAPVPAKVFIVDR